MSAEDPAAAGDVESTENVLPEAGGLGQIGGQLVDAGTDPELNQDPDAVGLDETPPSGTGLIEGEAVEGPAAEDPAGTTP
jgi:hypothetical protein